MRLTEEQLAILDHTLHRAPRQRYCGDSADMQELVRLGLMVSLGKASWCPDEFFTITAKGRQALAPRRPAYTLIEALVVMAIVAILFALLAGGVHLVSEEAKRMRTEAALRRVQSAFDEARYQADRHVLRLPLWQVRRLQRRWRELPPRQRAEELRRVKDKQHLPATRGAVLYGGLTSGDYYLGFGAGGLDPIHQRYRAYFWGGFDPLPTWCGFHAKYSPRQHEQLVAFRERYGTRPGAWDREHVSGEVLWAVLRVGYPEHGRDLADLEGDSDGDSFREFLDGWGRPLWRRGDVIYSSGPDGRPGTSDDIRAGGA